MKEYQITVWDSFTGEVTQHIVTVPDEVSLDLEKDANCFANFMHDLACEADGSDAAEWSRSPIMVGSIEAGVIVSLWCSIENPDDPAYIPTFSTETIMRLPSLARTIINTPGMPSQGSIH